MVVTVIESSEEERTLKAVVTKFLNSEARVAREETAEAHAAAASSKYVHKEARTGPAITAVRWAISAAIAALAFWQNRTARRRRP
jgi:hypothetical protein